MGSRREAARAVRAIVACCLCAPAAGGAPPGGAAAAGAPPAAKAAGHWAFRPPAAAPVPDVRRPDLARTPADRFVEAALEGAGLTLGPEASRETLARRVSFDLTGLSPSPEDVAELLDDPSPDAYERMVDRCLASPRHGERWGRHWLDAAGYADSNGYFSADSDRPLAYRYRDYVVASLNADLPFDRFVLEQLAGDELVGFDPDGDVLPGTVEPLAATGFLRCSQDGTGESDGNDVEVLQDKVSVLEGTVQIIGAALLGLTLQCARCHEHKFDPIPQAEYYALQAVFTPAYSTRQWLKPAERVATVGTRAEREEHRRRVEAADREVAAWRASLEAAAGPLRKLLRRERVAALAGEARAEAERAAKAFETPEEKRTEEEKGLVEKHAALLEVKDEDLAKRFEEIARVRGEVEAAVARVERARPPPLPQVAVLIDVDLDPPPHRVLLRGAVTAPGEAVEPGVPAALATPANPYLLDPRARPGRGTGRRLAFARWLVSEESPLLLRVTVNRLWQQRFGTGIVATSDNFGLSGARPSIPGLLDFLALELRRRGHSTKALHRLILTSAVYRQSSSAGEDARLRDPEGRLLSRFPLRRLEAEPLRDAMLTASGELDLRMGGPYVPAKRGEDGQVVVDEGQDGALRRSIYLQARRTQPVTALEVFDAPLVVGSCTRRGASTTALQSLALLNSGFVLARARAFARRLELEAAGGGAEPIERAFVLALGRGPSPLERRLAEAFLAEQASGYAGAGGSTGPGPRRALEDLCQMLFASNAFLYVD
ncbi:MAG: DUF1553 domain-containing protein [Planctomycetes bacterium]|nr:DUF1553 domain-containing protein [Planctomycetota bacterium]